jgi:hypothetical protein
MSDYPKKVEVKNISELMEKFIVLWRGEGDEACKVAVKIVDAWEEDGEVRVAYEVLTGPDKGQDFNARYDAGQTVIVYDEGAKALAILET